MALKIRIQYSPGASLGYSIERLSDGLLYDFGDGTFKASPVTSVSTLTEGTGNFVGRYKATRASTPIEQFTNGKYAIYFHNMAASNFVVGLSEAVFYNGDDAVVFPPEAGGNVNVVSWAGAPVATPHVAGVPVVDYGYSQGQVAGVLDNAAIQ